MSLALSLSTILEFVLAMLLMATLVYCAKLEKGLRRLRDDQEILNATVGSLNAGIAAAQTSLAALKAAAKEAGEALGAKVPRARALADELSVLVTSADRIASRIEGAFERPVRGPRPDAHTLGDSLRAVR